MQIRIHDPAQIGEIVRATRKAEHMRQDVTASAIGVSENFLGKVERGNSSVYWHLLLGYVLAFSGGVAVSRLSARAFLDGNHAAQCSPRQGAF